MKSLRAAFAADIVRSWVPGLFTALCLLVPACAAAAVGTWIVSGLIYTNEMTARTETKTLENAVDLYVIRHESLPTSLAALVPGEIREVRNDPWRHPYRLFASGGALHVSSDGPDGVPQTDDDITSLRSTP